MKNPDDLISQLNTEKIFSIANLTAIAFTIYALYYDFYICKMPLTIFNISAKMVFILIAAILMFPFKNLSNYQKILILLVNYSIYCPYYVLTISVSYAFASLQLFFVASNIFLLEKKHYLYFSIFIFLSTLLAIFLTKNPYPQVDHLDTLSMTFAENFITLFSLCFISYFYTHSKRIKYLSEELKFANLGKTSSFLIHEISKPILTDNSKSSGTDNSKNLKDLINITKYMMGGPIPPNEFKKIHLHKIIQDIVTGLDSTNIISRLAIRINIDIPPDVTIMTSPKGFEIIFANLFKNALEALAPFYEHSEFKNHLTINIQFDETTKALSISNPIFDGNNLKNVQNWKEISFTTKEGHQGVGLHIIYTLASKCNIEINQALTKNIITYSLKIS